MLYQIYPLDSGFGEYQCRHTYSLAGLDLKSLDDNPDNVPDIRGSIHYEPDIVLYYVDDYDNVHYVGASRNSKYYKKFDKL
jgi:hypothetical protein